MTRTERTTGRTIVWVIGIIAVILGFAIFSDPEDYSDSADAPAAGTH